MQWTSKKSIGILVVLFLLGGLGYGVYHRYSRFNRMVLERFEGRLWELPAYVYARPLELYPGLRLKPGIFEQALNHMRFQKVADSAELDSPGKYLRNKGLFTLFRRFFEFEDENQPAGKIQVNFQKNRVKSLQIMDSDTQSQILRLAPALIGSFYPRSNEDRTLLGLKTTPPLLIQALISVEDRTFYTHHGIEPLAILRALVVNIRKGYAAQGASTLSQQLAKNFFLTREKSFKRKLDEMFVAVAMEMNFNKDEILETYLNEVYLGQDGNRAIHGFGLASPFYFGKGLRDLKAHEIALLVGMLKGPSRYNPRKHPEKALKRRNTVLTLLRDRNILPPHMTEQAIIAPLGVINKASKENSPFPAYLDLVKGQLLKEYRESDLRSAGLSIFTTLDLQTQLAAEQAVQSELKAIEVGVRLPPDKLETGVVVTATGSNEVLALVGGRNVRAKSFNHALNAKRPIGSLVKPAVFLTALNDPKRYTLVTPIEDRSVSVPQPNGEPWIPRNYDRTYHGTIPLYLALVHSYNASTVRIGLDLGLPAVFETLGKMGFQKKIPMYPASLLGTMEMSPLEVAQIYQTLASGGFYSPIRSIRSIHKTNGSILQRYPLHIKQNFDAGPVYLLNRVLQTVVMEGTAASLKHMIPQSWGTASKTGTTNNLKDSWFAGFTGNQLAVVWLGRDDNKPCGLTGASGAMRV
ncbi:MAG: penicillin-binding protein 1B, partial [Deltaproteobacteria bacterium]|nr:penicillin-binding protein 1B [Deltaproteobacteria bacterium]